MLCRLPSMKVAYAETMELSNQIAVVTGGGRGLGRAFAETLANAGATVMMIGRSREDVDRAAAEIGRGARGFAADVTDAGRVRAVFREIGPVDVLVNNAGVLGPLGPFATADFEEWWRTTDVNLRGAMLCTHAALGGMLDRRRGRIVNIVTGAFSAPFLSGYLTSKTALVRATECLAAETKEQGVALFSFAPGTVRTDMSTHSLMSEEGRRWIPWFQSIFEQGLDLEAERPAAVVAALASGKYDALSGLFLTPFDDLNALLADRAEIQAASLHRLQIRSRQVSPAAAGIAAIRAAGGSVQR